VKAAVAENGPPAKKAKPGASEAKPVKLLSGGNPQIAKADGDARFLDGFANEIGVKIRTPRLAADVLQHFARRNMPTPFRWYEARLAEGTGKPPAGDPDVDQVAWLPLSEALAAMPYPAARRILEQIAQWPHRTIRGEYEVDYAVNPPGGSLRIIRDFSPEASRTGP